MIVPNALATLRKHVGAAHDHWRRYLDLAESRVMALTAFTTVGGKLDNLRAIPSRGPGTGIENSCWWCEVRPTTDARDR
jgi:hypothetical protein